MALKPTPRDRVDDDVFELTDIVEKGSSVSATAKGGFAAELRDSDVNFDEELEDLFSEANLDSSGAKPAAAGKGAPKGKASADAGGELDFDAALKEMEGQADFADFDAPSPAKTASNKLKTPAKTLDNNFDVDVDVDMTGLDMDFSVSEPPHKAKATSKNTAPTIDDDDDLFKDLGLADFGKDEDVALNLADVDMPRAAPARPQKSAPKPAPDLDEDDLFKDIDLSGLADEFDLGAPAKPKSADPDLGIPGLDEELDLFSPAVDSKRPAKPKQPSGREIAAADDIDVSGLDELIAGLDLPESPTEEQFEAKLASKPPHAKAPAVDMDEETEPVDVEIGDADTEDDDLAAMLKFAEEESEGPDMLDDIAELEDLAAPSTPAKASPVTYDLSDPFEAASAHAAALARNATPARPNEADTEEELPDISLEDLAAGEQALESDEDFDLTVKPPAAELDTTVLTGDLGATDDDLLSDLADDLGFDLEEAEAAIKAAAAAKELRRKPEPFDEAGMDQHSIDAALSGKPVVHVADGELIRRMDELEGKIVAAQVGLAAPTRGPKQDELDERIEAALARKWETAATAWSESLENRLGQLEIKLTAESAARTEQVAERIESALQRKLIEELEARLERALSGGSEFAVRLSALLAESVNAPVHERLDHLAKTALTQNDLDAALVAVKQDIGDIVNKAVPVAAAQILRQEIAALASELF